MTRILRKFGSNAVNHSDVNSFIKRRYVQYVCEILSLNLSRTEWFRKGFEFVRKEKRTLMEVAVYPIQKQSYHYRVE